MASTKLATLAIRTIAKPISNQIKQQAKEHETFRKQCVSLAQNMHRAEVKLRTNLLGDTSKSIRPLSEARAIENGANAIAEGFLFSVAAVLIVGETWRSSRSQAKRRDTVDDQIEDLAGRIQGVGDAVKELEARFEERWAAEKQRNDDLNRVLSRIIDVGLQGGWAELEDTPLRLPKVNVDPPTTEEEPPRSGPSSQT
ncbi:OPA3-domain-containing protein [Phellopilus nigrolimitatus]|nr:OPA3-domain-containing protein [Phellopilus nigrolimitatus]